MKDEPLITAEPVPLATLSFTSISNVSLSANLDRPWKQAVFSQYPRDQTSHRHRAHGDIMGYAVRTERYRYVEWKEWKTKKTIARELYDHTSDPHESHNIANQSAQSKTVSRLAKILATGPDVWTSAERN